MSAPQLPAGWIGYLVAVLTIAVTFIVNWRKGKIDESALVLGEWRRLYEAHEKRIEAYEGQITRLTDEFDAHREEARKEISRLGDRIMHLEQENSQLRQKVAQLEDENVGLKRMIAQNSQSTALMLGRPDMLAGSKAVKKEPRK